MKLSSVQTRKCELHQHCRRFYRPHLAQYNRSQIEHSYQDWDEFALYSYLCQGISSRFPLFTVSTLKNFNQINFNSTWKQWTKKAMSEMSTVNITTGLHKTSLPHLVIHAVTKMANLTKFPQTKWMSHPSLTLVLSKGEG